jgi:tripartite ATP-independent periplasmic transporter solute receptor, DctP family
MMTMGSTVLKKMLVLSMVCAMTLTLGCGSGNNTKDSSSNANKKITLKLAHNFPASHPLAKGADEFAKKVKEKSNGSITVTVYPSGQLYNDKSMNDAIMSGGIDMGLNTVGRWSTVIPAMEVFDVPFLFPTYEKIDKALDGGLGEKLGAELLKKGVRPLIWADYGFVQFANSKHAIKNPADFAGLKLRGYGEMPSETIKALGASPVTMGSGEVYMAMQRGVVDGQTSGTTAMFDRKIYEVAKYLTITNHAYPEFILAMNEKSFQKLSKEQQKIVTDASNEVRDELRKNAKTEDAAALAKLKEKGMEVYVVPSSEIGMWQAATKPCWDIFIQHAGKLGQELIDICTKE